METKLIKIIESIYNHELIKIDDNIVFTDDLKFSSLQMFELVLKIYQEFNVEINDEQIYTLNNYGKLKEFLNMKFNNQL